MIAATSSNISFTLISGFLLGFGLMAFTPYLQEIIHKEFSTYGEMATSIILVAQSLGGFSAPYLGNAISSITPTITDQFFVCAVFYGILTIISFLLACKNNVTIPKSAY